MRGMSRLLGLALLLSSAALSSERLAQLEAAVDQEPTSLVRRTDFVRALLERYRHTGQAPLLEKARKHTQAILDKEATHFEGLKAKAFADLLEGKYPEAQVQARRLNRRAPDDVEVYGYLVEAGRALGDQADAEKQANWMLRLRPQHRETLREAALLREDFGDKEGAIQMWNEMFRHTHASDNYERAWILLQLARVVADPQQAAKMKGQAKDLAPEVVASPKPASDVQPLLKQARSYLQQRRETSDYGYAERAGKLIEAALQKEPGNYEAHQLKVEVHLLRHEFEKVITLSKALIARNAKDAVNYATLGDALMETGQYDAAADAYQELVNRAPGLMSYNRIGWWRWVTGDAEGAIEMMTKAARHGRPKQEPTAWVLVELGHLYRKSGKLAEAGQTYQAALDQFPRMHSAHAGLGEVYAAQGKLDEAINAVKKAQAMAPMVEYAGLLADLYQRKGDAAAVKKQLDLVDLQAAMEAASGQKANRQIALIYADHKHRLAAAREIAEAELAVRKDVFSWDAYAWVLFQQGQVAEAAKAHRQAMRAGTRDPLLLRHADAIEKSLRATAALP